MFAQFLTRAGFRVAHASDGLEALAQASELRPDLIILDLSMPGPDGAEVARRLKANKQTERIPILLLTAYNLEHLPRMIREAGFAGFLMKPCLPDDLIGEVVRALHESVPG